jgi:hypothetical protein
MWSIHFSDSTSRILEFTIKSLKYIYKSRILEVTSKAVTVG